MFWKLYFTRGGVEDTRLEAKAKDTKKIRGQGQGQPFRGQALSRPRTGMLEAKAKDTSAAQVLSKKKKVFTKIFQANSKKKKKKKGLHENFSRRQNFSSRHQKLSSSEIRSSRHQKFSKKELFVGQRYRRIVDLKL